MTDRTAEIWATRLQREVGALASIAETAAASGTDDTTSDDVSHVTPKRDNLNIASLPPFVKVDSHELDVNNGICKIMFSVLVDRQQHTASETTTSEVNQGGSEAVAVQPPTSDASTNSFVFITLDCSMGNDGVYYPFQKPLVILSGGEEMFPPKSTIRNDDLIELDCDWTPSLHLSDAILNVALKIRESIRRGDPFLSETPASAPLDRQTTAFPALFNPAVDEISNTVSNFLGSLRRRKNDTPPSSPPSPPKSSQQQVKIGDVIDLSQSPYSDCAGMFSCKAIRRPEFVEQAMAEASRDADSAATSRRSDASLATQEEEEEENETASGPGNYMKLHAGGIRKVAASGFLGASSFFRSIEKSIVQSTKAVLEENYLLITQDHILEIRSSKLNIDTATVVFVSPIAHLVKLKFRRDESISLFFRQSAEDPLIYLCQESFDAVQCIQNVLQKHGVKGKHTTTTTQKLVQSAVNILNAIREKEDSLEQNPSLENVKEVMDLYRQAAEKFESSNDPRHEEVLSEMHAFLAKPLVKSILETEVDRTHIDGSLPSKNDGEVLKKEVKVETTTVASAELDESTDAINLDNDLDDFMNSTTISEGNIGDDSHDPMAELDAMLSAADKELNDLLESS